MTIIGITGGSGGGKTSALRALQSLGAVVIDCDSLYHELLEQNTEMIGEIAARFEGAVKDGTVDRKALGVIVFNDAGALAELNRITQVCFGRGRAPSEGMGSQGGTLAAVDAIALIESGSGVMRHRRRRDAPVETGSKGLWNATG